MKNLKAISIIFMLFLFTNNLQAQKFYTENGITTFDGSKAAFEPIKAVNDKRIYTFDYYGLINPGGLKVINQACKKLSSI